MYKIVFLPTKDEIEVKEGTTITKAMRDSSIYFDFPCGGGKKCGKCRVRILDGKAKFYQEEREFLSEKEIREGIHLACFTEIYSNAAVELLYTSLEKHKILSVSEDRSIDIEPHIIKKYIEVPKPTLENYESDWTRLTKSIFEGRVKGTPAYDLQFSILNKLPGILRNSNNSLTAVTFENELLGIEDSDTSSIMFGMAFDIGTTTIVGYLIDLYSGRELAVVSSLNPQTKYGGDLITRINYANEDGEALETLHTAAIRTINRLIKEACEKARISSSHIYGVTIAGNTCMHHLFLGLSTRYISQAPYVSTINEAVVLNASTLHIRINPVGKVLVLPNIAGFIGADTTAAILTAEIDKSEDIKLLVDIGTNGEVVLGCKERILACSCAAGPAFEGAQISSGMRGAVGAIDHVIFAEKLQYTVIGGGRPQGICGSGLLDIVAGLIRTGVIDERGRFLPEERIKSAAGKVLRKNVINYEGTEAFLVADETLTSNGRPILVTQKDIRELQVAKGAMASGIKILIDKYGISVEDIKEVLLAGAFGNYLNPLSACTIGIIPKELEGKIKTIGNAAGTGAKLALLSRGEYERASDISRRVEHVELASYPKFSSIFAKSTYFR